MPSRPDVGVVVVAAGRSQRAGGDVPKQFREVAGVPVLLRALRPFLAHRDVGRVVAVLPADAVAAPPAWLAPFVGERLRLVTGGVERADSVERGLELLGSEWPITAVHDGARPFVDPGVFDRLVAIARQGRAAIAAIPVSDTLKEATDGAAEPTIARTVPRERLWRAQTPQVFPRELLARALAAARAGGQWPTDDAAAVEALGEPVTLVRDRATNLKITTPDDFLLAALLAARGAS